MSANILNAVFTLCFQPSHPPPPGRLPQILLVPFLLSAVWISRHLHCIWCDLEVSSMVNSLHVWFSLSPVRPQESGGPAAPSSQNKALVGSILGSPSFLLKCFPTETLHCRPECDLAAREWDVFRLCSMSSCYKLRLCKASYNAKVSSSLHSQYLIFFFGLWRKRQTVFMDYYSLKVCHNAMYLLESE